MSSKCPDQARSSFHFSGEDKDRQGVGGGDPFPDWADWECWSNDNSQFLMTMNPVKLWCPVRGEIIPTYGQGTLGTVMEHNKYISH